MTSLLIFILKKIQSKLIMLYGLFYKMQIYAQNIALAKNRKEH